MRWSKRSNHGTKIASFWNLEYLHDYNIKEGGKLITNGSLTRLWYSWHIAQTVAVGLNLFAKATKKPLQFVAQTILLCALTCPAASFHFKRWRYCSYWRSRPDLRKLTSKTRFLFRPGFLKLLLQGDVMIENRELFSKSLHFNHRTIKIEPLLQRSILWGLQSHHPDWSSSHDDVMRRQLDWARNELC